MGQRDKDDALWKHRGLVRSLAMRLAVRVPPNVSIDDLIQVGMLGLMDALKRFDPNQHTEFTTFATHRIRGAMLDELRKADHVPRAIRRQQRAINAAVHRLEHALGRPPVDREIADEVGMPLHEFYAACNQVNATQVVYWEDLADSLFDESAVDPISSLVDQRKREALTEAIAALPDRMRLLMSLHYEHDLTFSEISVILKVTPSRISQLHQEAVDRLRSKLRSH